jgi:hypothetical protein
MKNFFKRFERVMMAAAFAEEGCKGHALEMMEGAAESRPRETMQSFLQNIGLQNVRVCYGVVRV